jgi:hypothetical protein
LKYETRVVDAEKGIVQITTEDERFYSKPVDGKMVYIPSVTWITSKYPLGIAYMKWLASKGFDEAEALKEQAGEKGSMVHKVVEMLLTGSTIMYDTIVDDRELTAEEYAAVMSFVEWFELYKPSVISTETTIFAPDNRYAGTYDLLCTIKGIKWLIDLKTSASIWPSHECQISAYRHCLPEGVIKLGILQLGYKYNKTKKWKFTEIEDQWELFNSVYKIWEKECLGIVPMQKDYPLSLTLNLGGENEK